MKFILELILVVLGLSIGCLFFSAIIGVFIGLPELKRLLRDYDAFVEDFEYKTWTIGGEIIFPIHNSSMNQLRGTNPYIMDRWDLTMECIRRFYLGKDSPLYEVLDRDRDFYELFVDFNLKTKAA